MPALAIAALGAWFVVLGLVALRSRPRPAEPAEPSMELPGPESPAVVNLLANGFVLTRSAVSATLLDLAARGFLSIQHLGPGKFVVRVEEGPADGPASLKPYERMVLELVHTQARHGRGQVPGEALTVGSSGAAEKWWRRFRKAVVAEARGMRLSRPRWRSGTLALLVLVSLAPAYVVAGALVELAPDDADLRRLEVAVWLVPLLLCPLLLTRGERDTAEGRRIAGQWLGLRRHLADDSGFADQPPGGVAIWDRYLAYGAAMGVARGAVRELPMGAESPTEAWSAYGGEWHIVRVAYPKWLPPGWGMKPSAAVLSGIVSMVPLGFMLFVVAPIIVPIVGEFIGGGGLGALLTVVFFTPFFFMAALAVRMLAGLVLGAMDLRAPPREVVGLVVRMREVTVRRNDRAVSYQSYVAVDDGKDREVDAWLVANGLLGGIAPGAVVKVWVTRRLGHVERIVVVDPA